MTTIFVFVTASSKKKSSKEVDETDKLFDKYANASSGVIE